MADNGLQYIESKVGVTARLLPWLPCVLAVLFIAALAAGLL